MIFIIWDGKRLCKDNCYREFANFGTFKECVRIFRYKNVALRKAKHQNVLLELRQKPATVKVAETPQGFLVNAVGEVYNTEDVLVGKLDDFTVTV